MPAGKSPDRFFREVRPRSVDIIRLRLEAWRHFNAAAELLKSNAAAPGVSGCGGKNTKRAALHGRSAGAVIRPTWNLALISFRGEQQLSAGQIESGAPRLCRIHGLVGLP